MINVINLNESIEKDRGNNCDTQDAHSNEEPSNILSKIELNTVFQVDHEAIPSGCAELVS